MIKAASIVITYELLALVAEIDEFKGAWRAMGTLAPERLPALRRVATIESNWTTMARLENPTSTRGQSSRRGIRGSSISTWIDGPARCGKVDSEPKALSTWFAALVFPLERIGLEAGPLSQWLHAAMAGSGLAAELPETRHVRNAFKIMPVKTDKKDARGIAQLMRLGWFRAVHCKSLSAREVR